MDEQQLIEWFRGLEISAMSEVLDELNGEYIGAVSEERERLKRQLALLDAPKVKPTHRDPVTGKQWAGRGKQPKWLTDYVAAGRDPEEFRV